MTEKWNGGEKCFKPLVAIVEVEVVVGSNTVKPLLYNYKTCKLVVYTTRTLPDS